MRASLVIAAAALLFALGGAAGVTPAQDKWPSKPIRMIVPFTSGSASDVTGRIVAQRLAEIYGQQLVVDNRPGAGGLIGSELVRDAPPDGYTIAMIGQPHLSNVLLRATSRMTPLKDSRRSGSSPSRPTSSCSARASMRRRSGTISSPAKPGALNYGSAESAASHLAGAMFASKAKINVVHVPFRLGADSRAALVTGAIHYYIYPLRRS
jgi:tripartite-type tricarboxylate transporter receptor subunit TctC